MDFYEFLFFFLHFESCFNFFISLFFFQENQIDSISLLANPPKETLDGDVTEVMAVDKASCQCSKAPAQCDCCAEFKIFGHSVKGNIV